jgi:signal transduction histidine kinase
MTLRGSLWRRLVGDRPIVTRLVLAVALTMTVVLVAAGGFVFWRVSYALDRQVDQDLAAYQHVVQRAVADGASPPSDTPGQSYQVYAADGHLLTGNSRATRLVDTATVTTVAAGTTTRIDVGHLLPAAAHPYRVVTARVQTPHGPVVVATAISRHKHDEALRELLLQLTIAGLATLLAASFVGYRTARAALNPVERYRRAAEDSHGAPTLPVDPGKDDEVTRLGHTFNALLDRIAQANERERQFLADASHELRSPLALMRTELEVAALRSRGDPDTATTLDSLRGQVERLISLSNSLLDLEELRAADAAAPEQVDLDPLVAAVTDRYQPEAAAQGRRIQAPTPTGYVVSGQPHWLEVALGNLVSNALRYGTGTVTIATEQAAGKLRLTVTDEGPGFPVEFVTKAFDRFSRAEPSRTSGGTGLGLSIVQAVAEAHHGTATVTGPATVTLTLPLPDKGVTR